MDANIERWYSMEEITEYFGVSRNTVLNWIEKHNMPAAKIGAYGTSKSALQNKRRYL